MGRRKTGRDVHGVLLLDKPAGPTSNAVLQRVRRLFQARRAGHGGTLDPFATGLLPLCFGEATKFSGPLLEGDKTYRATVRLGSATATGDPEGEVVARASVPEFAWADLEAMLAGFQGEIEQVPPMYSALKHQGRRLYDLARAGREVERAPRRVRVHALRLLALEPPEFRFEVSCGKGTYVRTLAEDMARALGTVGHTRALRRVGAGPFDGSGLIDLETLESTSAAERDDLLLPVDAGLAQWPALRLSREQARPLGFGQEVGLPGETGARPGPVRLYCDGIFLGVGDLREDGRIRPRRLVAGVSSR